MLRRLFAGVTLFFVATLPFASSQQPFEAKAFKAAADAGRPILIEVHADWCPTCRAQLPILDKLSGDPAYRNIARFRVDFDKQKDVVKQFQARMQSTLILFKGSTEVARSVGETDEGRIRALLDTVKSAR